LSDVNEDGILLRFSITISKILSIKIFSFIKNIDKECGRGGSGAGYGAGARMRAVVGAGGGAGAG
jgi:hypothetical protein